MARVSEEIRLLELQRALFAKTAKECFPVFLNYMDRGYDQQWFHKLIAQKCQELYDGALGTDGLMLFVPPQHGKSEIVSRRFPAWVLGKNPKAKIAGASYSSDLAQQFCRSIQRTMSEESYGYIFPETKLASGRASEGGSWLRNVDIFETVGYGGFYKAVGVGGSLTGTSVDVGIIDDPVKDAMEAYSSTYRERVWNWYTDVFSTRMHNESKRILIMTRWHEDDLAGRILKIEPEKWTVISIQAIKEDAGIIEDPRAIGESLWEERHSQERLREIENASPRTFAALYQQRPVVQGGNIVKSDWFRKVSLAEFKNHQGNEPVNFLIDTAYTEKTTNDPTGIIGVCGIGNNIYITKAKKVNMKFPDLVRFIPDFVYKNGYGDRSSIRIEPKANGLSVIDQLRESTGLNVTTTPSPTESKETRLNAASPTIECGRVFLVEGSWNDEFIDEVCGFPTKPHDEYVDLLWYAIDHYARENRWSVEPISKDDLGL
jgi:predicted phage terminase large subunit-like protein